MLEKFIFNKKDYLAEILRKSNISHPLIRTRIFVCISGGKKCKFFGKFCVRTKWLVPRVNWNLEYGCVEETNEWLFLSSC